MLGSCFAFISTNYDKPSTLWSQVRLELSMWDGLAPLIVRDLSAKWSSQVHCVDASEWGLGVCEASVAASVVAAAGKYSERWRFREKNHVNARLAALQQLVPEFNPMQDNYPMPFHLVLTIRFPMNLTVLLRAPGKTPHETRVLIALRQRLQNWILRFSKHLGNYWCGIVGEKSKPCLCMSTGPACQLPSTSSGMSMLIITTILFLAIPCVLHYAKRRAIAASNACARCACNLAPYL